MNRLGVSGAEADDSVGADVDRIKQAPVEREIETQRQGCRDLVVAIQRCDGRAGAGDVVPFEYKFGRLRAILIAIPE